MKKRKKTLYILVLLVSIGIFMITGLCCIKATQILNYPFETIGPNIMSSKNDVDNNEIVIHIPVESEETIANTYETINVKNQVDNNETKKSKETTERKTISKIDSSLKKKSNITKTTDIEKNKSEDAKLIDKNVINNDDLIESKNTVITKEKIEETTISKIRDIQLDENLSSDSNVNNEVNNKNILIAETITKTTNEEQLKKDVMDEEIIDEEIIYEHDGVKYIKGELVGNFSLSGYCSCTKCTNGTGITASGKKVRENHTIAADLNILPMGTMIILDNAVGKDGTIYNGVYQVEDRGGGIKNKRIDIYRPTHDLASLVTYYGRCYGDVYIAISIE